MSDIMAGIREFLAPSYRIVDDDYEGYQVQFRAWWWPFWMECGYVNSHDTVEEAEQYAANHARGHVKYLGKFLADPRGCHK